MHSDTVRSVLKVVLGELPPAREEFAASVLVEEREVLFVAQHALGQECSKLVGVFPQEALTLFLHNLAEALLLCGAVLFLAQPRLLLGTAADAALLEELLDGTAVLRLAHAALLGVHLLQALVVRKLLHHLATELLLLLRLGLRALLLDLHLVLVRLPQSKALAQRVLDARHLLLALAVFLFLDVQLVADALHLFLLPLGLLHAIGQLLVHGVLGRVGLALARLHRLLASALLLGVATYPLVLLLDPGSLPLAPDRALRLEVLDVALRLLLLREPLLQITLILFVDARDNLVDHLLLAEEVVVGLLPGSLLLLQLSLEDRLVRLLFLHARRLRRLLLGQHRLRLRLYLPRIHSPLRLLLVEHGLLLRHLHRALLVHVGAVQLELECAQLRAVLAHHLANLDLAELFELLTLERLHQLFLLFLLPLPLLLHRNRLLDHAVCFHFTALLLKSPESAHVLDTVIAAHVGAEHVVPVDIPQVILTRKLISGALLVPPRRMHSRAALCGVQRHNRLRECRRLNPKRPPMAVPPYAKNSPSPLPLRRENGPQCATINTANPHVLCVDT
eukprot:Opistho-1_new@81432